ncbi:hypothetical protein [Catenuloplanes japonicus]|uniref:hypothetical protein n=1 Tax=Catenuloplanes japonicus TaxID=33876 RepID=UPI00052564EE|nr:hypothetical protein [Catenuloplanes japonicus]
MARDGGEAGQTVANGGLPSLVALEADAGGTPPGWPSIADYWPDAPHRIGPAADVYQLDENAAPVLADNARTEGPVRLDPPPVNVLRRPPAAFTPEKAEAKAGSAPEETGVAPDSAGFMPEPADAAPGRAGSAPGKADAVPGKVGFAPGRAEIAPEQPVTEEVPPGVAAAAGAAAGLGAQDQDPGKPTARGWGASPHDDGPRDPFEDLILAEDFQHLPAAQNDDLHWDGETSSVPRTGRGGRVLATVALALLLLVGLTALIVVQLPGGADDRNTTAGPAVPDAAGPDEEAAPPAAPEADAPAEAPADDGLTASAPLGGLEEATFALLTDATVLSVRTTSLDDDLFRISTPEQSGVRANAVTEDDEVRLFLKPSENEDSTAEVEVLLSDQVRWSVRLLAGVDEGEVDLSAADVAEVTLAGGATTIDLSLPSPTGTLPITLTKGANQLTIRTPGRAPARVAIRQGAGKLEIDGRSKNGIGKGEVFQTSDWQAATDRLDLDASAGLGTLTIESA